LQLCGFLGINLRTYFSFSRGRSSTAASIAIGVLEKCFKDELTGPRWLPKLKEIIPSYGESLIKDAALTRQVRTDTAAVLHLDNV
jgi:malate dehydrogenase (quinone)